LNLESIATYPFETRRGSHGKGAEHKTKVLATVISLMGKTYIPVLGTAAMKKCYGSYGLTTLKDKHVSIKGDKTANFLSKAKKAYRHISLYENKKAGKALEQCAIFPEKELFQYYDEDGDRRSLSQEW